MRADLHLDEQYLTCIGKGDKERLIPIGEQAADWVRRYQRDARPELLQGGRTSPRLFLNARGGSLSRVGFWKILKAYGAAAGLPRDVEPARPAAFVRDAPARARRRSARDPDDARARRPVHDADLHARARSALAHRIRSLPPARVILIN